LKKLLILIIMIKKLIYAKEKYLYNTLLITLL